MYEKFPSASYDQFIENPIHIWTDYSGGQRPKRIRPRCRGRGDDAAPAPLVVA